MLTNAARRVNHRSLGRRDKPDEEARRCSIEFANLGWSPAAKLRGSEKVLGVTDRLVFLPRAGTALLNFETAVLRQGNSK